jgi:hypothetical protein
MLSFVHEMLYVAFAWAFLDLHFLYRPMPKTDSYSLGSLAITPRISAIVSAAMPMLRSPSHFAEMLATHRTIWQLPPQLMPDVVHIPWLL